MKTLSALLAVAVASGLGAGTARAQGAGKAATGAAPSSQPASTAAPSGPPPLSPEERRTLREIEKDFSRYEAAALQHHARMRTILYREYQQRKHDLEEKYAERIDKANEEEHRRRLEAMALLEKFIADYPDHPQFTPDAMFRLANLYLDQANEDFEKRFDAMADAAEAGDEAPPPDEGDDAEMTGADYSKSIGLWTTIITDFPEYRQRAGTLYLLAYYLKQTGKDRRALQIARGLVCKNKYNPTDEPEPAPDPDLVRERLSTGEKQPDVDPYQGCQAATDDLNLEQDAWVRIVGDIHFLTPGELPQAIAAYKKVADDKESKFYDEALYKLAWSYYRNDDFLEGIRAFDRSIKYSDELVAQGKEPLELRPEALQYIAISFTDPWSVEEQADPARAFDRAFAFYKDRFDEPHVRDVWVQMGDTFQLLEAYPQAIDSWRLALKHYPLHPKNPIIHQKIVSALAALGDRDAADEEAAKLADLYAPGSEWYTANETNREAMEAQQKISERMLRSAAENTHRAAQKARQDYKADPTPENKERYIALYKKAAGLYDRFIHEYPTADEVYEFTYRLGETLFFAEEYMESIPHYRWVRDHRSLSEKRFEKAAASIVQAYEMEVKRQVAAGELAEPPVPTVEDLKKLPKPIQAKPIPTLYQKWQSALDKYQQLVNDPKTAPNMGYLAGLISYRYLDLNDAAQRFQKTFNRFCGSKEAIKSWEALLAIYEATGQDAKFKATNRQFTQKKCGSDEDIQRAKAIARSKEFREAEELSDKGKFGEAAVAFYTYYKRAPKDDPNVPVALYNAALNYDKSGKPKTAVYLYKEFTSHEGKEFTESEYYLTALYLTAVSYNNAFDYDNAVKSYLKVVDVAGEKGREDPAGIDLDLKHIKLTALYNAAVLRELDRVYRDPKGARGTGAVSLYRRYAKLTTDQKEKDKALWAVARVYESAQDLKNLSRAYADWRQSHGRDAGNADKYVYSYYNLAKMYEKKGVRRQAARLKSETIKAWATVGKPKGTAAADMAAEFAFEQAEDYKKSKFDKFKIRRAPRTKKQAERILDQLDKISDDTRKRYQDLGKYESGEWGMAALCRIGDVAYYQGFKIKDAPIPKEIVRLDRKYPDKDILLQYQDTIQKLVDPLTNQASKQWEKVVEAGRQQGLANKWTQLAQERLHDFIDQQAYPVLRKDLVEGTEEP